MTTAPPAPTSTRMTAKKSAEKIAHKRMSTLQLAETLDNVLEMCWRGGIDRTSFYEFKQRFQPHGLEGLKDPPPVANSHPLTTPHETIEAMVDLAIKTPTRAACASRTNCAWAGPH